VKIRRENEMILEFESINNIRDLGGIKCADGRRVKRGLLLRSGDLSRASDGDIFRLEEEYAVSDVIDLRDEWETKEKPDRLPGGAEYHNMPAFPPFEEQGELVYENLVKSFADDPLSSYKSLYKRLAQNDHSKEVYSRFMKTVIGASGTVLWHCRQGKDRTGVAAILLLTALGADERDIIADYLETNDAVRPMLEKMEKNGASREELDYARLHGLVMEECVAVYFDTVKNEHGSLMEYITGELGITQDDIEKLREKYLDM